MFFNLIIFFLFIIVFYYFRNFHKLNLKKNVFKTKKLKAFTKKNLNNWMNLTKKERYNISKQESITYLDKRKLLLAEIRKEYKKISKLNPQKNTKAK